MVQVKWEVSVNCKDLYLQHWGHPRNSSTWLGPVFCLLLGVSSDYAQPITGQVTSVTCPVIGRAHPELTPSQRQRWHQSWGGCGYETLNWLYQGHHAPHQGTTHYLPPWRPDTDHWPHAIRVCSVIVMSQWISHSWITEDIEDSMRRFPRHALWRFWGKRFFLFELNHQLFNTIFNLKQSTTEAILGLTLQWHHNECDGISNHQLHECLLNRLLGRRSKKTSKVRVTGLYEGNSSVTGDFPHKRPVMQIIFHLMTSSWISPHSLTIPWVLSSYHRILLI